MKLTEEKSRDRYTAAADFIKSAFDRCEGCTDAEYLDAARSRAFGICHLPSPMPVSLAEELWLSDFAGAQDASAAISIEAQRVSGMSFFIEKHLVVFKSVIPYKYKIPNLFYHKKYRVSIKGTANPAR